MISVCYLELSDYINDYHVLHVYSIYDRHFLPFGRAVLYNRVGGRSLCCKGFAVDNHRPDLTNQTSSFAPSADPT
jgi:hypothetical protein